MIAERVERRLAAILAADVAGYSRLMGEDEEGTLAALKAILRDLFDPGVKEHKGRIVKTAGDGFLIVFASVVDAVGCALAVQKAIAERNLGVPQSRRIEFRMGVNLGDIIRDRRDIFGEGVNIAARLEGLAEPGGICVSAVVRDQVRGRILCTFDDMGERSLKNIAGPVRVYRVRPESAPAAAGAALSLPDKPSIAVLPFQNLSGDPEQDYFADGMAEEIVTALSRIRWLFVIARNSSFTYKGQAVDVKRAARELGVRYLLEGSVRKARGRVRITARLIDGESGADLWADRFDGSLEDVFELQDRVAFNVAGVIEPTLKVAERRRAAQRPTSDLGAYDAYLRAVTNFWPISKERVRENLALLEQAIERDPHYGPALAWAAICHLRAHQDGWAENPQIARQKGLDLAREALRVAGSEPETLANAAYALAYFGEDIGAMLALVDRALSLNPSFARGWYLGGLLRLMAGEPDRALADIETSLRLSPRDPVGTQSVLNGIAHFFARRFDAALPMLELAVQERPASTVPHRFLAACYAHLGRLDDARAIMDRLEAFAPAKAVDDLSWRKPEHRDLLSSGLRLAKGEKG